MGTYFFVVQPAQDRTTAGMVLRKEAEPALGLLDDDIAPGTLKSRDPMVVMISTYAGFHSHGNSQ